MAHTHTKIPLTDGETRINKLIMDYMQDGILDVHEREKKSESRLDYIETKMSDVLYEKIEVISRHGENIEKYGNTFSDANIKWRLSKDASSIEIYTNSVGQEYSIEKYYDENGNIVVKYRDNLGKYPASYTILEESKGHDISAYESISLKKGVDASWKDPNSYIVKDNIYWTVRAVEKVGKKTGEDENGDPVYTYNSATAYCEKVYCEYRFYWGASAKETDFTEEFVKGLKFNTDRYGSQGIAYTGNYTFSTAEGATNAINGEYIYFAFPATIVSGKLKYDIDGSGFKTDLVNVGSVSLLFPDKTEGETITRTALAYNLYRSENKLTSTGDANITIYS